MASNSIACNVVFVQILSSIIDVHKHSLLDVVIFDYNGAGHETSKSTWSTFLLACQTHFRKETHRDYRFVVTIINGSLPT